MLLIVLLCILLAIFIYAIWLSYRIVFYSPNKKPQDVYVIPPGEQYEKVAEKMLEQIHELQQLSYEQVYIKSFDGTKLAAMYYHNADNAPVVIQFHGYRGNAIREYAGCSKLAIREGFNSLVVDQRGHGKSGGHTITFGIRERYDCKAWAEYAAKRFGNVPVFLCGVSMGAATVLMASNLDLPANVKGIIADCPYSSSEAIIRKVCCDVKFPDKIVYPFVVLGALIFGGFRIGASSALESVKQTNLPILLIHGDDDRFVPCDMSNEIKKVCNSDVQMLTVPSAGHGISYLVDTEKYEKAFADFIKKYS